MARRLESDAGTFSQLRPLFPSPRLLPRIGDLRSQMAHFLQKQSHQVVESMRQVSGIEQNNPNIGHRWRNKILGLQWGDSTAGESVIPGGTKPLPDFRKAVRADVRVGRQGQKPTTAG